MLLNRSGSGCIGGDFNCITNRIDCTSYPVSKMSPSLTRLLRTFKWTDSFRALHPSSPSFSRYYVARGSLGATRIYRHYHLGHTLVVKVPDPLVRILSPKSRPLFKIREEIAKDVEFKARVEENMTVIHVYVY